MRRVCVGLIGTGYWARVVHGQSLSQHPCADLVGVWGRDAGKVEELAGELGTQAYLDLDSLLDSVDALAFAVPPDVQAAIAVHAADRGRHLLLEKPLAITAADAQRLETSVTASGVASIVFFTRRFRPETQSLLQRLSTTGDWQTAHVEFASNIFVDGGPFADSAWRRAKGALWDIGPHALALLWPVLGPVETVVAGRGSGDLVHLILGHANGASSTISLTLTAPPLATGDMLYFDGAPGREIAPLATLGLDDVLAAHQQAVDDLIIQMQAAEVGHPCDVHFGARVVEVLEAAEQALQTSCLVRLRK